MTVPGALALSALFLMTAPTLGAQLISIKTVPIAQGDQFNLFPSLNQGMGGVALAASFSWARLNAMDGVDLLYPGSQSINQFGHEVDVRAGLLKEWAGDRALDAVVLHNHLGMSQDVSYLDLFWDPGTQSVQQRPRVDHELDRTDTWGLQLQYERPLTASGWRIGWLATGNLMSHPKIPNY